MKKQIYLLLTVVLLASSSVMANDVKSKPALTENQIARISDLTRRVEEIKNMDKSDLSRTQRKALRNELLDIKKEVKATNGGVYLSVGAIIIILLVLILII
jgi:protein-disulfide isomerase